MNGNIIPKYNLPLLLVIIIILSFSTTAGAWTRAKLKEVHHKIEINENDLSALLTTTVKFDVYAGRFHGFDLAPVKGAELDEEAVYAVRDTGEKLGVSITRVRNEYERVWVDSSKGIRRGGVTFVLPYSMRLQAAGVFEKDSGKTWFRWKAPLWEQSMEKMSISILTGREPVEYAWVDEDEINVEQIEGGLKLVKHRPVRWYTMTAAVQVSLPRADAASFINAPAAAAATLPSQSESFVAATGSESVNLYNTLIGIASHKALIIYSPLFAAFLGFLLALGKWRWLFRRHAEAGVRADFVFLRNTGPNARVFMSVILLFTGVCVQVLVSAAAGVLPLALTAALWMVSVPKEISLDSPGGQWKPLSEQDRKQLLKKLRAYHLSRMCLLDGSQPFGKAAFVIFMAFVGLVVYLINSRSGRAAFIFGLDSVLFMVPVWACGSRKELVPDPLLEGFRDLRRLVVPFGRIAGRWFPGTHGVLWARYLPDGKLPVEVRMRLDPPPPGIRSVELAKQVVRRGTAISMSQAIIIRLAPNTQAARDLAACALADEVYLTPDLEEEVIILRTRRSRDSWIMPLKTAFRIVFASIS